MRKQLLDTSPCKMAVRTRKVSRRAADGLYYRRSLRSLRSLRHQNASLETQSKWKPQSTTRELVSGGIEWGWTPVFDSNPTNPAINYRFGETFAGETVWKDDVNYDTVKSRYQWASLGAVKEEMRAATRSYTVNYNPTKWSDSPSEMAEYQRQQLVQFEKDTVTAIEKKRKKDVREAKKVAQKAGKDSLARLKAQLDDPDWTCSLCFEKNYIRSILSCKHMYCTDCWTKCKNHGIGECPQCREPQF